MSILVLQHSDIGTPGRLGATLRDHGFRLDIRRGDLAPVGSAQCVPLDLDNIHGLLLMGGPQNVTDLDKHPWMAAEMDLIRKAHAKQLPVIGICLGAQMIAHALGGTVAPRDKPAIGFYDMDVTIPGQTDTLMAGVPWHSPQLFSCGQEVKSAPAGATVLASAKHTKVIAYRVGLRTFASRAHFECD
ncbi:MAG: type 1 glutamine amidotransferase, partial [Phycisphaerales bacterium]